MMLRMIMPNPIGPSVYCGTPTRLITPPSRTAPNAVWSASSVPTHSSTACVPSPPVSSWRGGDVERVAGGGVGRATRLERGNAHGASESVLEALARALHLDEAERAHLFDLAWAAGAPERAAHPGLDDHHPGVRAER